ASIFVMLVRGAEPMEKRQQRGLFTVPGLLLAFCSHTIASKCFYSFFTLPDFLGLRASPYHFKTPKHSILNFPSFFL
ncbi:MULTISPECIES: hypothetical protein, partial [Bacteria]|uniref:hypothetical protein n=1 Tax=Bacteria TaxID=2 RepID=UPI0009327671